MEWHRARRCGPHLMMHVNRTAHLLRACLAALVLWHVACAQRAAEGPPRIQLTDVAPGSARAVEVVGLNAPERSALLTMEHDAISAEGWHAILKVSVQENGEPIVGSYALVQGSLRFTPLFPFDAGRLYVVRFDRSQIPLADQSARAHGVITTTVHIPRPDAGPQTVVKAVYPSADVWPANQLRVYVEFSSPMGQRGGMEYVHLLEASGAEVVDAFLPLDYDYWNADRTRFTLFIDPGRVGSGLMPRTDSRPSIGPGREYSLVVDAAWPDGQGRALERTYRRTFRVGPPDVMPIDLASWQITIPRAGTTDALKIAFGESLDRALLMRAVAVWTATQEIVDGEIRIDPGEQGWSFSPEDPWQAGEYAIVALSVLEDLAGNQIGKAFDVATLGETPTTRPLTTTTRPFMVR